MPSRRTTINRPRTPVINAEMVAEFKALELAPKGRRDSQQFKERDIALHQQLGLWRERFCYQVSVLNARPSSHRVDEPQHKDWARVREARHRLLVLAGIGRTFAQAGELTRLSCGPRSELRAHFSEWSLHPSSHP